MLLVENELNELSEKVKQLSAKVYYFFLGRMYFTGDIVRTAPPPPFFF